MVYTPLVWEIAMMRAYWLLVVLTVSPSTWSQEKAPADNKVTPEEFERLHKEIRPRSGEAVWAEIPWLYDLHKARARAAKDGKPLCVWRMAGDPTGVC
jgi:hypothetical protein